MRLLLLTLLFLITAAPASAQWRNLHFPDSTAQIDRLRLAGTPTGVVACAEQAGLWTYTESTGTWQQVDDVQVMNTHFCGALVKTQSAYVAGVTASKMFTSPDGVTWTEVTGPLNTQSLYFFEALAADGDDLYALVNYHVQGEIYGRLGVYRTSVSSWGWTEIAADITAGGSVNFPSLRGLAAHGGHLYAVPASQLNNLQVSHDGGKTWQEIPRHFLLYPAATANRVLISSTSPAGFFRSFDDGASWDTLEVRPAPNKSPVRIAEAGSTLFMGDQDCKLYYSKDNAVTWTLLVDQKVCAGSNTYFDLTLGGSKAYTVHQQNRAVFQTDVSSVVTSVEATEMAGIQVQVAPHPAQTQSLLRVHLAAPALLVAEVYDVLGRRLLVEREPRASAGDHTIPLSVEGWAAGTYVLRVTAGTEVVTRPLVVVR